ncbi:DUF4184 family protein [Streptomyces sp. WM6378]|uniref:DUF4184 family protein n=1 Tax=Streptomyces sp. WM6378 TaxID=1415557 RepID=UPI0006AFA5A9|nr:DUF4184 family protein [Streptomyces sp. WM6378]KOU36730.1 hypothetical protein ADK54_32165 [Streptomyces sp. WM6378]
MPFTLSHAAAVLPGIRRDGTGRGRLVASALVAGSFAPDVTYYVATVAPAAMPFGRVTHSALGVVTVDVATTCVLVALWVLLREPLLALLPRASWRSRVYAVVRGEVWRRPGSWAPAGWFALSAAIGSATHVVWDAFTHFDRWGMRVLPVLGEKLAGFPLYWYAQYGGSALALTGIGWFTVTALRRANPAPTNAAAVPPGLTPRQLPVVLGLLALCTAAVAVYRCLRWYAFYGDASVLGLIPSACFGGGTGLTLGLLAYAAVWRSGRLGRTANPAAPDPVGPGRKVTRAQRGGGTR